MLMFLFGLFLIGLGFLGLIGMSGALLPLARLCKTHPENTARETSFSLAVYIPAHNEAEHIRATIESILEAAHQAKVKIRVVVGADSCTDDTAALAKKAGAEIHHVQVRNKWQNLCSSSTLSLNEEWISFVDAGTVWPKQLLTELKDHFATPEFLGIAPAYSPKASFMERSLWQLEANAKEKENSVNGPVSVHGATVFYRRSALQNCFQHLQKLPIKWLNDDIVLPIALHSLYPSATLFYWRPKIGELGIRDLGIQEAEAQFSRRKRMVIGNLQWIILLLPGLFRTSPASGILALRRVFRLFWGVWPLSCLFGFSFLFAIGFWKWIIPILICGIAVLLLLAAGKRGLVDAFLASILAPFWSFSFRRNHRWN